MTNPLAEYFREVEFYTALNSGTEYYSDDIIELNSEGEVGIRPMTGPDELALKNPDMLLNGEAFRQVLKSCITGIKDPDRLLNYDAMGLMLAIKHATHGDSLEHKENCPQCQHENVYSVNLLEMARKMEPIVPVNKVELKKVDIYIRPYLVKDTISASLRQFKFNSASKKLNGDNMTDEQIFAKISNELKELSSLTSDLIVNSIIRITDKEGKVLLVNDNEVSRNHIIEYFKNITAADIDTLNESVTKLNNYDTTKKMDMVCTKCKHMWSKDTDINPINFSTGF